MSPSRSWLDVQSISVWDQFFCLNESRDSLDMAILLWLTTGDHQKSVLSKLGHYCMYVCIVRYERTW